MLLCLEIHQNVADREAQPSIQFPQTISVKILGYLLGRRKGICPIYLISFTIYSCCRFFLARPSRKKAGVHLRLKEPVPKVCI